MSYYSPPTLLVVGLNAFIACLNAAMIMQIVAYESVKKQGGRVRETRSGKRKAPPVILY